MSKAAIQELLSALSEKGDDGIIHRTFGVTVKADTIDKKARSVRVIASTDSIDSYDEIVEQDWEKRLGRYKKNPVVLYNHNKSGFLGMGGAACDTLPIGSASDVRIVDGHLEATLHFVDDLANPMGEKVWQGFLQGSIRAVSVGFMPHSVREEKQNDVEILRLCDNELYEISAVAMPANADAVALSAESGSERQRLRARARAAQEPNLTALAEKAKIQMDLAEQLKKAQDDLVAAAKAIETEKALSAEHKTAAETAQTALQTSETALKALETELEELKAKNALTTTEKDAVRIPEGRTWPLPVYYLRLEIELISGAVIMKITSNTSRTSIIGVTFISAFIRLVPPIDIAMAFSSCPLDTWSGANVPGANQWADGAAVTETVAGPLGTPPTVTTSG